MSSELVFLTAFDDISTAGDLGLAAVPDVRELCWLCLEVAVTVAIGQAEMGCGEESVPFRRGPH